MRGRWFGAPRGGHRVPEPGTLLAEADQARGRAAAPTATIPKVTPPADTLAFDVAGSWTGPLPVRVPGASRPPSWVHALPPLGDLRRVRDRIADVDAEPPPPVVTEVVFHRGISRELRRDHAQLPVFRGTVQAIGGQTVTGGDGRERRRHPFANLHMRAPATPSTASGGNQT